MKLKFLVLFIIIVLLTACGLEDFRYLGPPISPYKSATMKSIEFHHNIDNDDPDFFKGYELYYRIYDKEDNAKADVFKIQQYALAQPVSSYPQVLSLAYKKLQNKNNFLEVPLVSIPAVELNIDHTITLDITNLNQEQILLDKIKILDIVRYSTSGTNTETFEFSSINSGDSDFSYTGATTSTYYIVFVAFSYGFNVEQLVTVYSQALVFDAIELTQ